MAQKLAGKTLSVVVGGEDVVCVGCSGVDDGGGSDGDDGGGSDGDDGCGIDVDAGELQLLSMFMLNGRSWRSR